MVAARGVSPSALPFLRPPPACAPLRRSGRGRRKAPGERLAYPAMAGGSRPVNVRSSEAFMIAARWVSLRSTHPTKRTRPVGWVERSETHHGPSTRLAPPTSASMAPMAYGLRLPANPEPAHAPPAHRHPVGLPRSEEHTSELQSLMPIQLGVFC